MVVYADAHVEQFIRFDGLIGSGILSALDTHIAFGVLM